MGKNKQTNKILCPNLLRILLFPKKFNGSLKIVKCLVTREIIRNSGSWSQAIVQTVRSIAPIILCGTFPLYSIGLKPFGCPLLSDDTSLFPPNVKKQDQHRGGLSVRNQNCRNIGWLTLQKNNSTHDLPVLHTIPVPGTLTLYKHYFISPSQ